MKLLRVASDRSAVRAPCGKKELVFLGNRLVRLVGGNLQVEAIWGKKVYRKSDEMLRHFECFTSVRKILWRHNAPNASSQSGEMVTVLRAKKCSRGLKEEKMSRRERQEGESGESSGGGRGALRYESVWREKTRGVSVLIQTSSTSGSTGELLSCQPLG